MGFIIIVTSKQDSWPELGHTKCKTDAGIH